jgi:subtilase family serine protease
MDLRRGPRNGAGTYGALGAAVLIAALVPMVATAPSGAAPASRLTLSGTSWMSAAAAAAAGGESGATMSRVLGPSTTPVSVRVYLAPRGGVAAQAAAVAAVSTPGSPQYRHFLTPAQYRAEFGPPAGAVALVRSWLTGAGMRVLGVGTGERYVAATGGAGAVQRAFDVSLEAVTDGGVAYEGPDRDASVPASVSADVLGVTGLDDFPSSVTPSSLVPTEELEAPPCSRYWGQRPARTEGGGSIPLPLLDGTRPDYTVCGYSAHQLASAYGLAATSLTGAGVTVAVVGAYASPTVESDADTLARSQGLAPFASGQLTEFLPSARFRDAAGCITVASATPYTEETMDIEAIHALAPRAAVDYYAARSCSNLAFVDALDRVVDDDRASIVSDSWGAREPSESSTMVAAYEQAFSQGALEGIGFYFASGDHGGARGHVQYPASDPSVTAVGATSTAIGAEGTVLWQSAWGGGDYGLSQDRSQWQVLGPFTGGTGGGFSERFPSPAYQRGVVPGGSPPGRGEPDIAIDGDPLTGMLIGITQLGPHDRLQYHVQRQGGTSLACPLVAAVQALATQAAGRRLGFFNPTLYRLARHGAPGALTDVTGAPIAAVAVQPVFTTPYDPNSARAYIAWNFGRDNGVAATSGWDDATGVGVPGPGYVAAVSKAG